MGWAGVAAVIYFSLTPKPLELDVEQGDKLQHAAAYASLMLWFAQLYVSSASRRWLALSLFALGVGMEFGQMFTPNRTFSVLDMVANAFGVLLGWYVSPPRTTNVYIWVGQRE